ARRFELFMNGMEIANGYFELTDPAEQKARFEADNRQRAAMGLATMPVDEQLLAALQHGMPTCAGVALGVDRLLMVIANTDRIEEVIAFKL
ncbi:MAG: amino acid--tRNA ligase-related protein, partial [Pseudohongiellaceae bacterium]